MTETTGILIVEDEILIAMDLEDELADRGFASICATSVPGARRLLENGTPSLAILDMHLRSETTFELADQLQDQGISFIFLSGNDASFLPDHLKSHPILTKPVRMEDVVEMIGAIQKKE